MIFSCFKISGKRGFDLCQKLTEHIRGTSNILLGDLFLRHDRFCNSLVECVKIQNLDLNGCKGEKVFCQWRKIGESPFRLSNL